MHKRIAAGILAIAGTVTAQKDVRLSSEVGVGNVTQKPIVRKISPTTVTKTPDIVAEISGSGVRTIRYNQRDIPLINMAMAYTTVFVLPAGEKVRQVTCGAPEDATGNEICHADGIDGLAQVRLGKARMHTNLNIYSDHGNVYSFLLYEGTGSADLKVVIEARDEQAAAIAAKPKWVPETELEHERQNAARASKETVEAKEQIGVVREQERGEAEKRIAAFTSTFPGKLHFDYKIHRDRRNQFGIQAMAHSDNQVFIWATPQETPVLYEVRDSKPSLIQYSYSEGVYTVNKVISEGYLAVGKRKLKFSRGE